MRQTNCSTVREARDHNPRIERSADREHLYNKNSH